MRANWRLGLIRGGPRKKKNLKNFTKMVNFMMFVSHTGTNEIFRYGLHSYFGHYLGNLSPYIFVNIIFLKCLLFVFTDCLEFNETLWFGSDSVLYDRAQSRWRSRASRNGSLSSYASGRSSKVSALIFKL